MNQSPVARITRWLVAIAVVGFVVALAVFELETRGTSGVVGYGTANYAAHAEPHQDPAPAFTLPVLEGGGSISLHQYLGHIVVLNLWASWCGPCHLEAPGLEKTFKYFQSRGIQFLGVNERDNFAAARGFVSEFHITYPSGYDPEGVVAPRYGLIGLPSTLFIDPAGQILERVTGPIDAPRLRAGIEHLLAASSDTSRRTARTNITHRARAAVRATHTRRVSVGTGLAFEPLPGGAPGPRWQAGRRVACERPADRRGNRGPSLGMAIRSSS